jgi:hypothetical protein
VAKLLDSLAFSSKVVLIGWCSGCIIWRVTGILKVQERHELELLLMTHKIVNKNCPPYLHDLIKFVSDASSRTTRAHKFKLRVPFVGVEAPDGSFSVKSCCLWNNLSEKLCANQNINSFKSELNSLLFKRYEEEK